jgi:hypothetical protein
MTSSDIGLASVAEWSSGNQKGVGSWPNRDRVCLSSIISTR